MAASLWHKWRDTIYGSVISLRRLLIVGGIRDFRRRIGRPYVYYFDIVVDGGECPTPHPPLLLYVDLQSCVEALVALIDLLYIVLKFWDIEIESWFQKQKPLTFSSAPMLVEANNWITHIKKIFEVLGCDDQFKAWLATYKLEGDAHSWWRAYKQAKGGAKAVTPEEQARNFKWVLNDIARDKLVNMEFSDMAEVANAARNIEILQKEMLAST
ncbi:hypothetical protein Tco_0024319 [Tanacetum coccineum]